MNPLPDTRDNEELTVRQMMILQNEIKDIHNKTFEEVQKMGFEIIKKMLELEKIPESINNSLNNWHSSFDKKLDPIKDQVRETAASVSDLKIKASEQIENQKKIQEDFKRMSIQEQSLPKKNKDYQKNYENDIKEQTKELENKMNELVSLSKRKELKQESKMSYFNFEN
jgi:TolA-binding protein